MQATKNQETSALISGRLLLTPASPAVPILGTTWQPLVRTCCHWLGWPRGPGQEQQGARQVERSGGVEKVTCDIYFDCIHLLIDAIDFVMSSSIYYCIQQIFNRDQLIKINEQNQKPTNTSESLLRPASRLLWHQLAHSKCSMVADQDGNVGPGHVATEEQRDGWKRRCKLGGLCLNVFVEQANETPIIAN